MSFTLLETDNSLYTKNKSLYKCSRLICKDVVEIWSDPGAKIKGKTMLK